MVKAEPQSPATAALASRISKYSYSTPSPSKSTPTGGPGRPARSTAGASDTSPRSTRSTRTLAAYVPLRSGNDGIASEGVGSPVVSPYFTNHSNRTLPNRREADIGHVPSDDDLESLDGSPTTIELPRKRRKVGPSRGRTRPEDEMAEMEMDELDQDSSEASGSGSEFNDIDGEDEDDYEQSGYSADERQEDRSEGRGLGTVRQQTRIRARRAGRADRTLLPEPAVAGPSTPSTKAGKRMKQAQIKEEPHEEVPTGQSARMDPRSTPKAKGKKPRAYADPETYQHLRPLPDLLAPDLEVVFCGINPGLKSSTTGHHFAHPTNKFWRSLHFSGLTSRLVKPEEDHLLPTEFNYGMTVLVDRPTAEQSELSTYEMRLNVLPFTEKLLRIRPAVVCFVGKKIWDVYESVVSKSAQVVEGIAVPRDVDVKLERNDADLSTQGTEMSTPRPISVTIRPELGAEVDELEDDDTKAMIKPVIPTPASPPPTTPSRRTTPASARRTPAKSKLKEIFDWTQPRAYRLPHRNDIGSVVKYTYFWVVPNTSGLERTPLAEQIVLFGHLNTFKNGVKDGVVPAVKYRDINLDGVRKTVEEMKRAKEAKREVQL